MGEKIDINDEILYKETLKYYNKYKGEDTKETYRCKNGAKINLPIYYRNKIYTE